MRSELTIPATDAERHLERLCDHFRRNHELDVKLGVGRAVFEFADGWCVMEVQDDGLHLWVKSFDAASLSRMEAFIGRHLQRLIVGRFTPVLWSSPPGEEGREASPAAKLAALAATLDQAAVGAARA